MSKLDKFFSNVFSALYKLIEAMIGFIFITPFAIFYTLIFILSFIGPIIFLLLFAWEWGLIGEKKLLISERFEAKEHIFQKMTELSFTIDAKTQSVIVKLESPTRNFFENPVIHEKIQKFDYSYFQSKFFAPKISMETITSRQINAFFDKDLTFEHTIEETKYLKKVNRKLQSLEILRDTFTPISQLLISLDNCTVESSSDWVCQDQLPFLLGVHTYIGSENNNWIIDYEEQASVFSLHEFFDWKTLWWFEKRKCSNFCFIETVESFDARAEKLRQLMGQQSLKLRQMLKEQRTN